MTVLTDMPTWFGGTLIKPYFYMKTYRQLAEAERENQSSSKIKISTTG